MELPGTDELATVLDRKRLLVVEDDLFIAMQIESILRDAGAAAVEPCSNVERALALTDEQHFDAAILDVRLEDSDITLVAHRLAECGTPFIFYTGQSNADEVLAQWPQCKVLSKPASWREIVNGFIEVLN